MADANNQPPAHESNGATVSENNRQKKIAKRRARYLVTEISGLIRRHRKRIPKDIQWSLCDQARSLLASIENPHFNTDSVQSQILDLDLAANRHLGFARKSESREFVEIVVLALLIAVFIRIFLFEPFKIPTGSMIPTLRVDDHIFVSKFVYGVPVPFTNKKLLDWRQPDRGEVVVFTFPGIGKDQGKDYIKRIVAVGGDRVRLTNNIVVVNDNTTHKPEVLARHKNCLLPPSEKCEWRPKTTRFNTQEQASAGCPCTFVQERTADYTWITQHIWPQAHCYCRAPDDRAPKSVDNKGDWPFAVYGGASFLRGWGDDKKKRWLTRNPSGRLEMEVPEGFVFVMGDNRDNSHDGRYWGLVPVENIKGKAWVIWWSRDQLWNRWFQQIHG